MWRGSAEGSGRRGGEDVISSIKREPVPSSEPGTTHTQELSKRGGAGTHAHTAGAGAQPTTTHTQELSLDMLRKFEPVTAESMDFYHRSKARYRARSGSEGAGVAPGKMLARSGQNILGAGPGGTPQPVGGGRNQGGGGSFVRAYGRVG